MGNPPFVGHQWRTKDQVEDLEGVCKGIPKYGKLDYVCGWFIRATEYIQGTTINVAFVSTNSITQGESVAVLWKPLFENHIHIDFAYRTFVWTSEAKDKAAVHCVIIGFSCCQSQRKKYLFDHGQCKEAIHINGYLLDAPNVFIQSRGNGECDFEETKTHKKFDAKFLLSTEQGREIGSRNGNIVKFPYEMYNEASEYSQCIPEHGEKKVYELELYRIMERLILKNTTKGENLIFFIPYPIVCDFEKFPLAGAKDVLKAIYLMLEENHRDKCESIELYVVYVSFDNKAVLRNLKTDRREYFDCPKINEYVHYDVKVNNNI